MSKRQTPTPISGNASLSSAPPFLPLEESMRSRAGTDTESSLDDVPMEYSGEVGSDAMESQVLPLPTSKKNDDESLVELRTSKKRNGSRHENKNTTFSAVSSNLSFWKKIKLPGTKQVVLAAVGLLFALIIWECFFVEPENRLIKPDFSDKFLDWVQSNPGWGLGAILLVIAAAVVSLVPIGTPLTLGCGYIYRGVYGWKLGLLVSTVVSMAGSTLGAVICFLLGRYLMRDTVKRWVRNYPMFDAIDIAVSEQGIKIMAMLYLTPVLPLGLVSYMCGTTAIDLYSFAVAKIASLPLYLMYTFMGASAHSIIKGKKGGTNDSNIGKSLTDEANKLEENQFLIVSGLVLSVIMMTLITRKIKKELMKILDKQKKEKIDGNATPLIEKEDADEKTIELGLTARRKANTKKT
mmetsp:Transcript_3428/g.8155  ORF Transcript_3428/g.8155 Transcript_3428/m.8155 type:complete len:408 (-) Transcript_3428:370-1593(-)|eukprot:CAMPEP_0116094318 /NCGR_PEP_ID=MMETSP0327-20121206/9067_1 /TAXON_ID=44447 /ORGANISM="Pseudo-nitzschia delicatissima, Strain B596" /LENGTH=407 /DNA_ID=CAMNT_0003585913 /DNA_START=110 /DNA_END=1333 /DNA_ORIENTATION=+